MIRFFYFKSVILAILVLLSPVSHSQSITILGNSAGAKECYFSAQLAAQMHSASLSEVETCTQALAFENLSLRDKAATFVNRGVLQVALEDYKAAVNDYKNAMNLMPEFGAIYVNRGNLFFLGEAYDKAIDEYSLAMEKGVRQAHVAHLNRGMAYEKIGEFTKALSDYRIAIEMAPEWTAAKMKHERVLSKIEKSPS